LVVDSFDLLEILGNVSDHGEKSIFGIQCPDMKFLKLATMWW